VSGVKILNYYYLYDALIFLRTPQTTSTKFVIYEHFFTVNG